MPDRETPPPNADQPPADSAPTQTAAVRISHPTRRDEDRFPPGTILAGRYRILGPLGKGGMGTVYRADDLKLEHPVALKFLPEHLVADDAALQRLYREIRIAREVSHPNVCRTYDLGEEGGERFIVMEYVGGEDLASLLLRIGRLPGAKALDVARQLCAGLTAAHERGVLHRDLKPANVMLDGRGRVRIMDFGIAVLGDAGEGAASWAGTPAYMAPEQLDGGKATVRSDIYALGLVLYEVLTGKSAFAFGSLREMRDGRRTLPPAPSSTTTDIDPVVEQIVLRCLEENPERRPSSVVAVSASLPGGDPLAAALAAGETPSPEMVARAGLSGALNPKVAAIGLLAALVLTVAAAAIYAGHALLHVAPLDKPPAVLVDRAREILKDSGYTEKVLHTAGSFYVDSDYLEKIRKTDSSPARWKRLTQGRPWAVGYWYRTSPDAMLVTARHVVSEGKPVLATEGMARLRLDPLGRLRELAIVSRHDPAAPAADTSAGDARVKDAAAVVAENRDTTLADTVTAGPGLAGPQDPDTTVDWSMLFRSAGLPMDLFHRESPCVNPRVPADHAVGWSGTLAGESAEPFHIAAASCRGKPVYFEIVTPWEKRSGKDEEESESVGDWLGSAAAGIIFLVIVIIVLFLAWRSLRSGRGDRRAARRVALYFSGLQFVGAVVASDMVPSIEGVAVVGYALLGALPVALAIYLAYIVLEPFVRRYWPHAIISWARLLSGSFRDPMVGRDILAGCVLAGSFTLIQGLALASTGWTGHPPPLGEFITAMALRGGRQALGTILVDQTGTFLRTILVLFLYLFSLIIIKRKGYAALVTVAFFALLDVSGLSTLGWAWFGLNLVGRVIVVLVMVRFGMLTIFTAYFVRYLLGGCPVTFDFSRWYAGIGLIGVLIAMGLATWGAWTAAAGQPLFREERSG